LHDTYFVVGHFHLMIGGVTLMAAFAAINFWFPKMFGRMMHEPLSRIHFWLTFPTFYSMFILMHFQGLNGMARRYYAYDKFEYVSFAAGLPTLVITVLAFILGAAQILFLFNFFGSIRRGKIASQNPWNAATLEWTTESPAPHGNWRGDVPRVYRWPYDYSLPGAGSDVTPQNVAGVSQAV
jgi:cytochrome c oxidase subunit I